MLISIGNLKYQFFQAIEKGFVPGRSKHADVRKNEHYFVYSYADRNALRDTASDFSKYMKEQGVKRLVDITPNDVSKYLASKEGMVSSQTLKTYQSRLTKLGRLATEYYHHNLNYHGEIPKHTNPKTKDDKIRTSAMKDEDFDKVMSKISPNSQANISLRLARSFGLRVSEINHIRVKDVDIRHGTLTIYKSKGGRTRTLYCYTKQQLNLLIELNEMGQEKDLQKNDRIITIKSDSINKALSRALDGIYGKDKNPYKQCKTGVHSLRKAYATERYNRLRLHESHQKAWLTVCKELGHSSLREDLFDTYVVRQ